MSGQSFNIDIDEYSKSEPAYREQLGNIENWRGIPLLNYTPLHDLKDGSLVRFRGMIQDMLDNETYLEQYEVESGSGGCRMQNGKYRDCFVLNDGETVNHGAKNNVFGERRTMFVVSVPGINTWASEFESSTNSSHTQKPASAPTDVSSSGQKRAIDENEEMEVEESNPDSSFTSNKRICGEKKQAPASAKTSLSSEYLVNSPIQERPGKSCMIKIYADFDKYLLNTVVDVIGFLSVDPAMDASTVEQEDDPYMEIDAVLAANPPPSLIPRLHAIAIRRMDHLNPLMDVSLSVQDEAASNPGSVFKDLRIVLTNCLFGDRLAAEYLLLHLISTVYIRTDLETLGQFTLNICNIPGSVLPAYTEALYEIIESLLPASHYFPMTLEAMNTIQFTPKKDYKTNKLTAGILQLAPHTHLVLDETRLEPGKLETNGVLSVQDLAYLIKTQQIKCDFQFYQLDFHTNISVLILSEGRSMLPSNSQIPLEPVDEESVKLISETLKAAKHYLQPKLNTIRKYLTSAKIQDFDMSAGDGKMIEDDFVQMRKQNSKFGADELHLLLVISRLLGKAEGKRVMDKETWEYAKEMEVKRENRLKAMPRRFIKQ